MYSFKYGAVIFFFFLRIKICGTGSKTDFCLKIFNLYGTGLWWQLSGTLIGL